MDSVEQLLHGAVSESGVNITMSGTIYRQCCLCGWLTGHGPQRGDCALEFLKELLFLYVFVVIKSKI